MIKEMADLDTITRAEVSRAISVAAKGHPKEELLVILALKKMKSFDAGSIVTLMEHGDSAPGFIHSGVEPKSTQEWDDYHDVYVPAISDRASSLGVDPWSIMGCAVSYRLVEVAS